MLRPTGAEHPFETWIADAAGSSLHGGPVDVEPFDGECSMHGKSLWSAGVGPAVGVLGALLLASPARGQEVTAYGVGAVDGYDTGLALVGASVRPGGYGIQPVASLQTYYLQYDAGTTDATIWSIGPAVGVEYRAPGGSLGAKVGYNFQMRDEGVDPDDVPVFTGEAGGGGVTTSVSAQYWGGGAPELQGIASYGWRSDYLWSQAQATVPVMRMDPGAVSLGGEVIWEGEFGGSDTFLDDIAPEDSRAISVGPVVKWGNGRNLTVFVSGGYKDANFGDPTWYGRVGFARYGIGF